MGVQADLKSAIESGREDLIRVLAEHGLRPTVVEQASTESGLLGRSGPTFRLETESGDSGAVDRQTTTHVVDALGLDSESECEAVREEIEAHAAWNAA